MLNINNAVKELVTRALAEDEGLGDITTRCTVSEGLMIEGKFIAKENGIICGLDVVREVFRQVDLLIEFSVQVQEGQEVNKGEVIALIKGNGAGVLTGERVALNFLQRLSGIASRTYETVKQIEGTKAKITDTRKTTPGLRVLEKYAVRVGGGVNHRFNLSDGILIKDNHIRAAGGISEAILKAKANAPHTLKIEVEVENMTQLEEALEAGADIIMLDNMNNQEMKEAVDRVAGRALIEASGNMGDKDLSEIAAIGVDFISVGALTHSVRAMDISLRLN